VNGADSSFVKVTYSYSASDYAQYTAAVRRRQRRQSGFIAFLLAFFGAIPVAFVFRQYVDTRIADTIGLTSLTSYLLGASAMWAVLLFSYWRLGKRRMAEIPNPFAPRTVTIDATGVAVVSQSTEGLWHWVAITAFTCERGLLLLWVGPASAVAIPISAFESTDACQAAVAFIRARLAEARPASPE
jgi:hypothetical protein